MNDWHGQVRSVGAFGENRYLAYVSVNIWLDIGDRTNQNLDDTTIHRGTHLFGAISELRRGRAVVFSGPGSGRPIWRREWDYN